MKNTFKYFVGLFLTLSVFFSCAPDVIEGIDESGLPDINEMEIVISVNNETNKVTFHLENEGYVPIWIIKSKIYAQNDYVKTFSAAGTYTVEVKAYNRNGISKESVTKEFVVE